METSARYTLMARQAVCLRCKDCAFVESEAQASRLDISTSSALKHRQLSSAVVMFLVLLLAPMSTSAFSVERTTTTVTKTTTIHTGCPRHFGHRVQSCVAPFTSLVDMYTAEQDNIGQAVTIAKQICIEYQMVLTCLHTALTDCPTMKNLKRVQATLDSHWVTKINELCSIQSKSSSDSSNSDYKDLTNYIYQNNHPNHVDSYKIAREILHASMKTKAELEREVLAAKSQSGLSSIFIEKIHYFQPPQDNEAVKEIEEQNKDAKVELNIVNVIQNYNYPTAQKNDAIKHSTVHLVHAAYSSAASSSYGVILVILSAVAILQLLLL